MRYVAKIHVLDVMDQVVVSGYVYDADGAVQDGEPPLEFTLSAPGVGLSDPYAWLLNSLYRALVQDEATRRGVAGGSAVVGVLDTISESGDTRRALTSVDGGGRGGSGSEPATRSVSA